MYENHEFILSRVEENPEVLRERFQQWGYLYIKAYVEKKKCRQLLADMLTELAPHIVLSDNDGLPALRGAPFFETDAIWDEVFVYPMKMARISTPGKIGYEIL